ncbi:hypothetical protein LSH36_1801g00019 [Paralvinella palmiformis]|uniref:Uncharacterized protein n=1 Tax=Paralvinella palmiformis TaxID=53620 RepID=A0AAD9MLS6_9ANNE|nr:hypothetical protein LSH36_1801g00019 [Paralvinella palmiformis]
MMNKIDPSTLPCGMSLRISAHVDNLLFNTTCYCLPEKNFSIQVRRPPFMSYASSFLINLLGGTVTKTFLKSSILEENNTDGHINVASTSDNSPYATSEDHGEITSTQVNHDSKSSQLTGKGLVLKYLNTRSAVVKLDQVSAKVTKISPR